MRRTAFGYKTECCKSLFANWSYCSRPGTLPISPNRDVVESQFVPPQIEHRLIEPEDAFFRNSGRWRHELAQPFVDEDSLPLLDARQQMPQCERIPLSSLAQYDRHIVCSLLRCAVLKIESLQSRAERGGGILEVRRTRTNLRPRRPSCARRDKGLVTIQLESYPPEGGAHHACARIVDLQCVGATQIHRNSLWRVARDLAGRRPDNRMNRSAIQSKPLLPGGHAQQPQACARINVDLADIVRLQAGPRLPVGFKHLTNAETTDSFLSADRFSSDARCPFHVGHIPTRPARWSGPGGVNQECHCNEDWHGNRGGSQSGKQTHSPGKESPSSAGDDFRKSRGGRVLSKLPEKRFQPLDLGIRFARSVPQIIVTLCRRSVFGSIVPRVHD